MTKNKLTEQDINDQIVSIKFKKMGLKTTICLLTLKNGYEVIGKSGCVDPSNYDQEIGENIAYKNAVDKIWELEGYVLQELMFGSRLKN